MGVAFKGYTQIAKLLLDAGANPHVANSARQTALMMAALFGHSAIVDLLIDRGGDPHVQDAAGNSAISMAETQSNELMRLKARRPVLA